VRQGVSGSVADRGGDQERLPAGHRERHRAAHTVDVADEQIPADGDPGLRGGGPDMVGVHPRGERIERGDHHRGPQHPLRGHGERLRRGRVRDRDHPGGGTPRHQEQGEHRDQHSGHRPAGTTTRRRNGGNDDDAHDRDRPGAGRRGRGPLLAKPGTGNTVGNAMRDHGPSPDPTEAPTRRPTRRGRVALLAGLIAVPIALAVGLDPGTGSEDPDASAESRLRICQALQGDSDLQQENVVVCLSALMEDLVRAGRYPELLDLTETLRNSRLQASCHAAGHRVGAELYEELPVESALAQIFGGEPRPVDYICTTALVHGLIGGGENDGTDRAALAAHCLRLDTVDVNYTHECAHFYGHGVWRAVGELNAELAEECAHLDGSASGLATEVCLTGAVMQKFDLQTKLYDPFNEKAVERRPPAAAELRGLCDPFAAMPATARGCWGAVGWLAAMRAQGRLEAGREDDPAYAETATAIYTEELLLCAGESSCQLNFLTHFHPSAYRNGVTLETCRRADVEMNLCRQTISTRTGEPFTPES